MRQIHHPRLQDVALSAALHALSDPVRLCIVRALAEQGEQCCGACGALMGTSTGVTIPKPTFSHHLKVLREAGLIAVRIEGTQRCISLRRKELNARFPGLIRAVLKAGAPI